MGALTNLESDSGRELMQGAFSDHRVILVAGRFSGS